MYNDKGLWKPLEDPDPLGSVNGGQGQEKISRNVFSKRE